MDERLSALEAWRKGGIPVACVTVISAAGSTPREKGAFMFVSPTGQSGTVGGGALEWCAVQDARLLLCEGGQDMERVIPLGPESGQCCGGRIVLRIAVMDEAGLAFMEERLRAEAAALPQLLLFGAGHVGRALAASLALLPLRLVWIDSRPEEFGVVPAGVHTVSDGSWEKVVRDAAPGAGALVLTHNHALDALIVTALLERDDLAYVGMIGSITKRRRLERGFREMGVPEERIVRLVCPIGDRGLRDKRPEVIAALVAAEVVERLLHVRRGMGQGS